MTTYNTGNPIGSKDPRDLYDNAENLDEAVNTRTAESWDDRFGVARKTWHGMEQDFQQFLINSGYEDIGDYGPGLEITARNQIFWRDGELYRASAELELPYTTTGDWGAEEGLFVAVGDAALRQELATGVGSGKGGLLVAGAVIYVDTIADLQALDTSGLVDGQHVYVKEYYDGTDYGGGLYVNAGSGYSGSDAIEGADGTQWRMVVDNNVFPIDRLGALKGDPESVKDAFILAIECVRESGGGTVLVPSGEWTISSFQYEVNVSDITFEFALGCHFYTNQMLLGWYPTDVGVRYRNICITGAGTVESLFNGQWHNDLVYVDGVTLDSLTFIKPIMSGHFLDLMGCTDIIVDSVKVFGSNITRRATGDPRRYSEFIQTHNANYSGLGWPQPQYEANMDGSPTDGVTLKGCTFKPHEDETGATFPPRPIGNHGAATGVKNIQVRGNTFIDIIPQTETGRSLIELPDIAGVVFSENIIEVDASVGVVPGANLLVLALYGSDSADAAASIAGNTIVDKSTGDGYSNVIALRGGLGVANISGNTIYSTAPFSDLISAIDVPSTGPCEISIVLSGNTITGNGSRVLFFQSDSNYSVSVSGNAVKHLGSPTNLRECFWAQGSGACTISGNSIDGWPQILRISGTTRTASMSGNDVKNTANAQTVLMGGPGIMSGNIFESANPITVSIDGSVQTPNGWNYVVV